MMANENEHITTASINMSKPHCCVQFQLDINHQKYIIKKNLALHYNALTRYPIKDIVEPLIEKYNQIYTKTSDSVSLDQV